MPSRAPLGADAAAAPMATSSAGSSGGPGESGTLFGAGSSQPRHWLVAPVSPAGGSSGATGASGATGERQSAAAATATTTATVVAVPNSLLSTVNASRQRPPMCNDCERSLPNQIVFDKIESIIRKMQDEQNGLSVKTAKSFMTKIPSVFTGIDLIQWMMRNLRLEDQQEAMHLANLIASHGYIFPIEDHTLSIKNDCTFYRFQTPCLWPSNNIEPENTDYAVYLCKRTMQGKTRLELADYEAENLARLQKMFSRKWEFIFMQAESQAKVDKKRDKLERKVLDSQERAFWDVYRPVPGCVNTTELDIKKACRLSKSAKRCGECQKVGAPSTQQAPASTPSIANEPGQPTRETVEKEAAAASLRTSPLVSSSPASPEVGRLCKRIGEPQQQQAEREARATSSDKARAASEEVSAGEVGELVAGDERKKQDRDERAEVEVEVEVEWGEEAKVTRGDKHQEEAGAGAEEVGKVGELEIEQEKEEAPRPATSEMDSQMSASEQAQEQKTSGERLQSAAQSPGNKQQSVAHAHHAHHHHPHHAHHHHHHHHHHHPHSHAHHAHHHHHHHKQCPHYHKQQQQLANKSAAEQTTSGGKQQPASGSAQAKCPNHNRCSLKAKQRPVAGSIDQLNPATSLVGRRKSECNRVPSVSEASADERAAGRLKATSASLKQRAADTGQQLSAVSRVPPSSSERPSSACSSLSSMAVAQPHSAASSEQPAGSAARPSNVASAPVLQRKSSLNIGRPTGADQTPGLALVPLAADKSVCARKGSVASAVSHQRGQLKGAQSVCASPMLPGQQQTAGSQEPLAAADVSGSRCGPNASEAAMGELERELQSLRIRLDRGGVKMSKVTQSYLSYFNQWAEYDPFIAQPIPSNPWQSDSTELWDSERQTKEVHFRRVRRWAFSLKELLNDPAGREQFHRFLEKEFSAENLKFWDAVQELKRVQAKDVGRRVEAIWTEYLAQDANCPINIDSKSYETSKKNMAKNKNNRYIFDEAAGHVYQLMKNDSYPRYLRSDMYKDYKEASERRRPNQVAFDVFKPQITTLKHKFNF